MAQLDAPSLHTRTVPSFIKYMGSKAALLDFVVEGIDAVYAGGGVCDLFAGTAVVAGAVGRQVPVYANDIQAYSQTLARVYLRAHLTLDMPSGEQLADAAAALVAERRDCVGPALRYDHADTLARFAEVEDRNRALLERRFVHKWHYWLKTFSGTWWSAEQCLWIDAMREVAERHRGQPYYELILAALMHAMAYTSQGTGHFAQYRDAKTSSALRDILMYRRRDPRVYFVRRYEAAAATLPSGPSRLAHQVTALDYAERLRTLPGPCTVYADPPYCFVHYSRFYHALETLVRYDRPRLQVKAGRVVKGRYREERHQSPFCIRSQVEGAFRRLFAGVARARSNLVLSYSNTGMIDIARMMELAREELGAGYALERRALDHRHMTMGRRRDRDRHVEETLLLAAR